MATANAQSLNNHDIDVLMKALDAYQSKPSSDGAMAVMFGAMLYGGKENREYFDKSANSILEKSKQESKSLEEIVILLKAKLIYMRNHMVIEEMTDVLKHGE